jgi:hypothetical protein
LVVLKLLLVLRLLVLWEEEVLPVEVFLRLNQLPKLLPLGPTRVILRHVLFLAQLGHLGQLLAKPLLLSLH